MIGGQVGGGLGADGPGRGEEGCVLARAVEVQRRARVGLRVSRCPGLILQTTAEGAVGGVDGRTLEVGDAEAGGVEHGRNDLDVPGLGLV
jgi:hypothetical protein